MTSAKCWQVGCNNEHTIFTADGSSTIERLRFTFTPNGEREFVPRDQVSPLNCHLLFISST